MSADSKDTHQYVKLESQKSEEEKEVEERCPWTDANKTLDDWKLKCNQLVFIYNSVLENYINRSRSMLISNLIFASLTTLIGAGVVFIPDNAYTNIIFGLKIAGLVCSAIANILIGVLTIYGWKTTVTDCQNYLDLVQAFESQIITEFSLPREYRRTPEKFLIDQRSKYETILQTAPDIPHSVYLKALEQFFSFQTKYDDLVLVV